MAPSAGYSKSNDKEVTTSVSTSRSNEEEPILYDADVVAEWSPDDETALLAHTSGTSMAELPKRMLNTVRQKITRPLDGLTGMTANLQEQWAQRRGDWPIALSPDGRTLAVWRDNTLELRYTDDGFGIARATVPTSEDESPLWRQLAWSFDGQLLALAGSDNIVRVLDVFGQVVWQLGPARITRSGRVMSIDNIEDTPSDLSSLLASDLVTVAEPIAAVIFRSPRHLTDDHSKMSTTHELLVIASDGTLSCFQLRYTPRESVGKRKRDDTDGVSATPSAILQHTFSFASVYSTVTTAAYLPDQDCLAVAGWPRTLTGSGLNANDMTFTASTTPTSNIANATTTSTTTSSSFLSFWQLTSRTPYYRLVSQTNSVNASNQPSASLPSSSSSSSSSKKKRPPLSSIGTDTVVTGGEREDHVVTKLKDIWTRWRLPNHESVPMLIHLMAVSPKGDVMATLTIGGDISIWQWKERNTPVLRMQWTQQQLQNLLVASQRTNDDDIDTSQPLDHVISLSWWDDNRLLVGFSSGIIAATSLHDNDCTNCLGSRPFQLRSSTPLVCHPAFGALVLEKDVTTLRVRVQGDRIYLSPSTDEDDENAGQLTQSASSSINGYDMLVKLSKAVTHSLAYLTDTFLWQFESDAWKAARGRYVTFERRSFRLIVILEISPAELMQRQIALMEYEEALSLARKHNLSADPIYQARWLDADIDEQSIHDYLSRIENRLWVLDSCLTRVPATPDAMRLLIDYGLQRTHLSVRENIDAYTEEERLIWQYRWKLLDYSDRLETWKLINADRLEDVSFVDDYAYFRSVNMVAQAIEYAYQAQFTALTILLERHSNILRAFRFFILEQIPEHISPDAYQHLLPVVHREESGHSTETLAWSSMPWRERDLLPLDMELTLKQQVNWIEDAQDLGFATFPIPTVDYPALSDTVTRWYKERARHIDDVSGRLDYAILLLEQGHARGVEHLTALIEDAKFLSQLCYEQHPSSPIWTGQTLRLFEQSPITAIVSLMLSRVTPDQTTNSLRQLVLPYLYHRQENPRSAELVEDETEEQPWNALIQVLLALSHHQLECSCRLIMTLITDSTLSTPIDTVTLQKMLLSIIYAQSTATELQRESPAEVTLLDDVDLICQSLSDTPQTDQASNLSRLPCESPETIFTWLAENDNGSSSNNNDDDDTTRYLALQMWLVRHRQVYQLLKRYQVNRSFYDLWKLVDNAAEQQSLLECLLSPIYLLGERETFANEAENRIQLLWNTIIGSFYDLNVFNQYSKEDLSRIYFQRLLSHGLISQTKPVLLSLTDEPYLSNEMIEDIVLSVARDYFNNADTGDKYAGLMKKAILCLEILPITDKVQKEWDLIDIAYDVYRYAPQMAPVQIRYAPSRERLISLLISDNLQIYEQITRPISNLISAANSLLDKLGCQSQVAAQLVMFTSLLQMAMKRQEKATIATVTDELYRIMKKHPLAALSTSTSLKEDKKEAAWMAAWTCLHQWTISTELLSPDEQLERMNQLIEICPSHQLASLLHEWHIVKERQSPSTITSSDDGKWSMLVEATTTTTAAAATVVYHEFYQSSIVSSEDESIQPIDLCYHRWIQHQLDEYSNGHITNDIDDRPGHAHLASLSVRDHALWLAEQLWYRNLPSLDTMEATPYQAMLIAYGIGLQCISRLSTEKQRSHITEYPSGEVFRLVQQWSQSLTSCHNDEELHKQAKLAQAYLNIAQSSQENDLIKNLSSIRSIDVERFQQDAAYAEEILIDIAKNELDFSLITLDTLGQRRGVDEISILKARLDGLFSAQNSFDVFLRQVSLIKDMIRTKASLFQRALLSIYSKISGQSHGLLRQFYVLYQSCQNELKADQAEKEQVIQRIQLLGELVAASTLDTLDFHRLVEVGHTGSIERLHDVYMPLLSEETVFTLAALSPRIETLSLLEPLDAINTGDTFTSSQARQAWKENELESTVYFWFISSVFEHTVTSSPQDNATLITEWSSAMESFESLLDFMLNHHILTLLNTYAYKPSIADIPLSIRAQMVDIVRRAPLQPDTDMVNTLDHAESHIEQITQLSQYTDPVLNVSLPSSWLRVLDTQLSKSNEIDATLVDALLDGTSPLIINEIIHQQETNTTSSLADIYQRAWQQLTTTEQDGRLVERLSHLLVPLSRYDPAHYPELASVHGILSENIREFVLADTNQLAVEDRVQIFDIMDQYGVKAASNESTHDISFIKIAALIEKTWQVKISPSEVATSSDKYHWLTQQLERMTTTTVQVQTLMRILIIWSSDAQEDRMSAEECLDIWCRLFGWMITQEMYTWCYATRLFLYTQSDMDLDELDRRVLDQLAAAITGHLPYLLYCLLASDSQLVAKAVTDIRSDLNDTDKAAQLVSNDDLPILLCARSIITELATTSLMTSVIHRLFVCSCGDTSRNRHAWRRLLIGQVALNMELVGYDELSADIATRYLGIPSCVDSLSVRSSVQRAMETAAIKAEHEAQADRWQPPIIYQLDDNMDRHTLHHWIVHQFMQ